MTGPASGPLYAKEMVLVTEGPSQDRPVEKDQIKPFHAKEASTGQETADVLSAVLKHAAERDVAAKKKTAPKPQPMWMLPLGLTLSVLAGFLLVASPDWVVVNPIAAQAPEVQIQNLSTGVYMYGMRIENYRAANNRLPQTLVEAGVPAEVEGLVYTPSGDHYTLFSSIGEEAVLFDSRVHNWREWGAREAGNVVQRIGG